MLPRGKDKVKFPFRGNFPAHSSYFSEFRVNEVSNCTILIGLNCADLIGQSIGLDANEAIICVILIGRSRYPSIGQKTNQGFFAVVDLGYQAGHSEGKFSPRFFLVYRVCEEPLSANSH